MVHHYLCFLGTKRNAVLKMKRGANLSGVAPRLGMSLPSGHEDDAEIVQVGSRGACHHQAVDPFQNG